MIKVILALILVAHGIGHSMGMLQLFRVATINPQWNGDSWLMSGPVLTTVAQVVGVIAWTAALVGFVAVAGVLLGWLPLGWWAPLAIGSAVASMIGLLLFPIAFPAFSSIAAFAVDVAVIVGVAWFHWTPAALAS